MPSQSLAQLAFQAGHASSILVVNRSPAKALMNGIFRHPATFPPSPLTAGWLHRPFGWLEGALAPYGGHGGAEDAGETGSTNTDRQRTSARPLGDVGKGAGGSGTTPHRGSRDAYQESISGLRSGGQSFAWLFTAGQLASRVRPTSFLAGAVSDRRAVVRAWEQSRRPLRRH
jgi:hypothetical protein